MTDLFPPFAPDPEEARRRRFTPIPLRVLVPNVITLLALCLGLTAIRLAIEERLELAMIAIVIAAVLDGIDGRVARLLKGTSRFGAELDSLSDFVNFGVAPALILYSFVLHELRSIGWIAALVFAIAAALRLARFNVMIDDPARPEWQKNYFVGMAAPAGAICALLPIYLYMLGLPTDGIAAPFVAAYLVGIAFLMVSRIPTYAGKTLGSRVPREKVMPLFAVVILFVALLVSFTFQVLAIGVVVYLALIPAGVMRYRRQARADAERLAAERVEPAARPAQNAGPESGDMP